MVSCSPVTLRLSMSMSIREPLIAITSLLEGTRVKSIDESVFTVEVNVIALIVTLPLM